MRCMEELREELAEVFDELRNGDLERPLAAEITNTAGKMINSVRAELEYYKLLKEKPQIKFLRPKDDPIHKESAA